MTMEIYDARESLKSTIDNRKNTTKEDVFERINDAIKDGEVLAICGELYQELEELLLSKHFDIVRHIVAGELCNIVYWGENASGRLLDYTK